MNEDTALIEKPENVPAQSIELSEPSFDALIAKAIDKDVSPETMEKFLAMRRELKAEKAKEAFFTALTGFQAECPVIVKSKTGGGEKSYKYQYAPLDIIVSQTKELIKKHGFSYTIQARFEKDPPAQVAICTIHHIAGHSEESEFRAPVDATGNMNIIQKSASSLTYAKRYAFCNAFGILTGDEDDDAQGAGEPEQKTRSSSAQSDKPPTITHPAEWQELYDAMLVMMGDNDWYDMVGKNNLVSIKEHLASITAKMSIDSMKLTYDSYKLLLDTAKKQHDTNSQ